MTNGQKDKCPVLSGMSGTNKPKTPRTNGQIP